MLSQSISEFLLFLGISQFPFIMHISEGNAHLCPLRGSSNLVIFYNQIWEKWDPIVASIGISLIMTISEHFFFCLCLSYVFPLL